MTLAGNLRMTATVEAIGRALATPSPWADDTPLHRITWDELYPGMAGVMVTRAEAMAVPAMARARHLCAATIARMPLYAYRDDARLPNQPVWLYRADGAQSSAARIVGTVDDLIFHGSSLWLVVRDNANGDDRPGNVIRAEHIPWSDWQLNQDGQIEVNGTPIPYSGAGHVRAGEREAVVIPGMHEGVCSFGAAVLRGASRTLAAAVDVAEHPMRLELHDTGDYPMTTAEARSLIGDARDAMQSGSGVVYTTPGIESRMHAVDAGALLVDGRESFAVDVARVVGIPSAMIDAHSRGATMTYSTTADVIQSFLHLGLTVYMTPITARLSLDDVAPRGTEIRFDSDSVLGATALINPDSVQNPSVER